MNVVKANYEGILLTLQELDESNDVTAGGFLKKMKTIKFIGVIYILNDILPVLSQLSKAFQKGTINFSQINPQVNTVKQKLKSPLEEKSPLNDLQSDLDSQKNLNKELRFSRKEVDKMEALF